MPAFRASFAAAAFVVAARIASPALAQPVRKDTPAPAPTATATARDSATEIVVTASRAATVPAQHGSLVVFIEGTGDRPADAARRADATLLSVSEAIRQGGAATVEETTPTAMLETPSSTGLRGIPNRPAYRARYTVRVAVPHAADVSDVAISAMNAGARAATPAFAATSIDSTRRATYARALEQARRDAEAIATAMGMRLGSVIDVVTAPPPTGSDALQIASTLTVRYRALPPERR